MDSAEAKSLQASLKSANQEGTPLGVQFGLYEELVLLLWTSSVPSWWSCWNVFILKSLARSTAFQCAGFGEVVAQVRNAVEYAGTSDMAEVFALHAQIAAQLHSLPRDVGMHLRGSQHEVDVRTIAEEVSSLPSQRGSTERRMVHADTSSVRMETNAETARTVLLWCSHQVQARSPTLWSRVVERAKNCLVQPLSPTRNQSSPHHLEQWMVLPRHFQQIVGRWSCAPPRGTLQHCPRWLMSSDHVDCWYSLAVKSPLLQNLRPDPQHPDSGVEEMRDVRDSRLRPKAAPWAWRPSTSTRSSSTPFQKGWGDRRRAGVTPTLTNEPSHGPTQG